jgi:hypothetical protein
MKAVKPGVPRSRHEERQILRIGEECEDASDREGNPVFELELTRQTTNLRDSCCFPQETPPLARSARKILANK